MPSLTGVDAAIGGEAVEAEDSEFGHSKAIMKIFRICFAGLLFRTWVGCLRLSLERGQSGHRYRPLGTAPAVCIDKSGVPEGLRNITHPPTSEHEQAFPSFPLVI